MKIYTRKGDKGETSLIGGKRVKKSDLQVETYGTIDELNSYIGWIRDVTVKEISLQVQLHKIQNSLFCIGAILSSNTDKALPSFVPVWDKNATERLEGWIDELSTELPQMTHFILPGGHSTISLIHVARTVCRRAERDLVRWQNEESVAFDYILKYVNRLSDYLFVLSRYMAKQLEVEEIKWDPAQM